MAHHRLQISGSDGAVLSVWRSGSGPNLLLVHGTTADHTRWTSVAPLLERSFTVYAMDRRGRGGSTDGPDYSLTLEAQDIAAVAASVAEPIHLLGHSYGAVCCLEAAAHIPQLRRLILYEPPLPVGEPIVPAPVRDELDRLSAAGLNESVLLAFFRGVVRVPEPQLDVMRAGAAWPARVAAARTVAREIRVESEYSPDFARLGHLHVPTLLLVGEKSPAFFRAAIAAVHRALPNSRIQEIRGQQHIAMDLVPNEFVQLVTAFLLEAAPRDT